MNYLIDVMLEILKKLIEIINDDGKKVRLSYLVIATLLGFFIPILYYQNYKIPEKDKNIKELCELNIGLIKTTNEEKPVGQVPYSFSMASSGQLFIFKTADDRDKAGKTAKDNVYILSSPPDVSPLKTTIDFAQDVTSISSLDLTLSYEYVADTNYDDASITIFLKDSENKEFFSRPINFKPDKPTQRTVTIKQPIYISKKYTGKQLTIEAKPEKVGDFALYISSINGEVVTTIPTKPTYQLAPICRK